MTVGRKAHLEKYNSPPVRIVFGACAVTSSANEQFAFRVVLLNKILVSIFSEG